MSKTSNTTSYVFGSLTRISDLSQNPFIVKPLEHNKWASGDYVVGKFNRNQDPTKEWVETSTGRHRTLWEGDLLVGALGVRAATQEIVGDWHDIQADGKMQDICGSGMFGLAASHSTNYGPGANFTYQGHVIRDGKKVCMRDFAVSPPRSPSSPIPLHINNTLTNGDNIACASFTCPTILIIGTSMSCGKTMTATAIIHLLKKTLGVAKVVGAKLTGAGYLNDKQHMEDAGADVVYDFVDAGLPSTILPPEEYKESLRTLLAILANEQPDVLITEVGASPCEPYNGDIALRALAGSACLVVLCASDTYAALALSQILKRDGISPNFITGMVLSTSAGSDLVRKMCDSPPLSLATESGLKEMKELLEKKLALHSEASSASVSIV